MRKQFLIVGGSYAAVEAATQARENGYLEDILIVSEERDLPYHRPPLSKGFLKPSHASSSDPLRGGAHYSARRIDLELGVSVVNVTSTKTAELSNGMHIRFDSLLLAVGARARVLTCKGADCNNVFYLRSIEDARSLKVAAENAHEIVVIGGGFIGLEVASTLALQQKRVTVVEATDRVLSRVASPELSTFLSSAHTKHGVSLLALQSIDRFAVENGRVREVLLNNGASLKADLVVVGIGSIANLDIARQLDLDVDSGIIVDQNSQTSKAGVFAAGDCASHRSVANPSGVRLESVQNAVDQARIAGATVAGVAKSYDALPWFWSEQFDCKLQMAGLSVGATERVARLGSANEMSMFHFRDGVCVCIESVNRPREHIAARRLLRRGISKRQLQEVGFDVSALLKAAPI